ncbi:MAG: hypothetical protein ACLFQ6_12940 [Candidatus Sumerlaeia bacterium]
MSQAGKILSMDQALQAYQQELRKAGMKGDAILVRNPSYLASPVEIYPLADIPEKPLPRVRGMVMDMDGTTTTTEPLCLHSLEWMVRQVSGLRRHPDWPGLDQDRDYPNIIGNSTTKHVEYLLETYEDIFDRKSCLEAFIHAAAWTLAFGRDPGRKNELRANIAALGLGGLWQDGSFQALAEGMHDHYDLRELDKLARRLAGEMIHEFRTESLAERVRASIDIYYMRYHMILADIAAGHGKDRAREILGSADASLIEPMPAIGIMLAAARGFLGSDLALFQEMLEAHLRENGMLPGTYNADQAREKLAQLGRYLEVNPLSLAIVTSSIAYEAGIVLDEIFSVLRRQIQDWPVSREKKKMILRHFAAPENLYDAIITASDSSEIRLKPHRDLYAIALHTMGLAPEEYRYVVGFEDSESGVVAIRAAGIGQAVAVPFVSTTGHDLSAAAAIAPGQMPEVLLLRNCYLDEKAVSLALAEE